MVGDSGVLSVLLRRADGSFGPATSYAAQRGNLQLADLNGDGLPDIVTQWNLDVSVLLNRGDGTFADGGVYATTMECAPVLLADFNGDGLPDMAAAHKYDAALELFLGRGDGTFAGAVVQPLVASQAIAAGDLNGDGHIDLMTTEGRGVDVFLGNGDGTFRRGADYLGSHTIDQLGIGDFNADGRLDAVVAHDGSTPTSSDSVLTVLVGQGDGTFFVGPPTALDAAPRTMVLADVNGDGATDALVGDEDYAEVNVFLGGPDGRLRKHANYRPDGWVAGVAVADADGDGIPDLLTANAQLDGDDPARARRRHVCADRELRDRRNAPVGGAGRSGRRRASRLDRGKVDSTTTPCPCCRDWAAASSGAAPTGASGRLRPS